MLTTCNIMESFKEQNVRCKYVSYSENNPLPHTHPQRRDSGFMVKGLYSQN